MLAEPFFLCAVIRKDTFHQRPEPWRVIHLQPVAKLVDDHVVPDLLRSQHQQAVEIQIPFCGAAPPACPLIADGNASVCHAEKRREMRCPLRQILQGLLRKKADLRFRKQVDRMRRPLRFTGGISGTHTLHMRLDPGEILADKPLDFF